MKRQFLGDSYDLVKRFLIHTLPGAWAVHPMLTEANFGEQELAAYRTLLWDIQILSKSELQNNTDREHYFACCQRHEGPLLFDPNTGFKIRNGHSVDHLHQADLVTIVEGRPHNSLVMIYDQSFSFFFNRENAMCDKLAALPADWYAMGYLSHACFLFVSRDGNTINEARGLLMAAGIPERRMLTRH